jgi:redox-sensitive bicupin YhaK (pirin superfamily)
MDASWHGAWHSGGPGEDGITRGFQLWVALPPDLELGESESIYMGASELRHAGPARVLLGELHGVRSPIATPSPANYVAVTLRTGQRWRYDPAENHSILWLAVGR